MKGAAGLVRVSDWARQSERLGSSSERVRARLPLLKGELVFIEGAAGLVRVSDWARLHKE